MPKKWQKAGPVLEVSSNSELDDDQNFSATSARMNIGSKNASTAENATDGTGDLTTKE